MNKAKINIVLADDHPIMLNGIKQELEEAGYTIVGVAENGADALQLITNLKPDLAMLDIEMPLLTGFEVIKRCKAVNSSTKFIIMSYHKEKGFAIQAKQMGIKGYLLKEDSIAEIETCIQKVLKDEAYYSNAFNMDMEAVAADELNKLKLLSPSERTIIRLLAQGKNSAQIAETLLISPRTVQKHRSNIIHKLQLKPSPDTITQWVNKNRELVNML